MEVKRAEEDKTKAAAEAPKKKPAPPEEICADTRATLNALARALKYNPELLRYARQTAADQQNLWQPFKAKRDTLGPGGRKSRWEVHRAAGGELTRETFFDKEEGERRSATTNMQTHARKAAEAWRKVRPDFILKAGIFIDALEKDEQDRAHTFFVGYRQSSLVFGLRLALASLNKAIRGDDQIWLDAPKDFQFVD